MIPKIIHYCWFGGSPLPDLAKKCIASWKKYCPDYEIKEWNESNFDLKGCDFVREAYEAKKWAFVSDFARLKIVYEEGGIYLDTDVEMLKTFDALLDDKCFLGEETTGFVATGLGFGAEKHNPIIQELLEMYIGKHFKLGDGSYDILPCPRKNTEPLYRHGYKFSGTKIWSMEDIVVYPPEFFCPLNYETGELCITDKTFSVHLYNASWRTWLDSLIVTIERCDKEKHPISYRFRRVVSFPFRIINKIRKIGVHRTLQVIKNRLNDSISLFLK